MKSAPQAIQEDRYDYVVLREQNTLPVKNARRRHENVRHFDVGAKTVPYMTWA